MIIWIDAQLPPTLATWLVETFGVTAISLKELGLRDAKDIEIFEAATQPNLVIMTKDSDFVDLVCRLGAPPQILWITCGNVTNQNLRRLLNSTFLNAIDRLSKEKSWWKLVNDLIDGSANRYTTKFYKFLPLV
jgi:predicted nuclease of predicted toxin-antitoxin system